MRATEIIRNLLDLIDLLDCKTTEPADLALPDQAIHGTVIYSNSPDTHIQGVDAVTTAAGGGLNGPKNPADLRADSLSMFPNFQAKI